MSDTLNRGCGLLLIEAVSSNPNGDPDAEGDPRQRYDGRGEITPVSVKHKIRNLVADKGSSFWTSIKEELGLKDFGYDILECKDTKRADVQNLSEEELLAKYWDARVFGTTFLEDKTKESFLKTGVVQFGVGISCDPVRIERMTTTKVLPVEEDKSRGMAPLAFRVVSYGLYVMPFFINATIAHKTKCTKKDIELLLKVIPYIYSETSSYIRPQINIRHAFFIEHSEARSTFREFKVLEMLSPERVDKKATTQVKSWKDYDEELLAKRVDEVQEMVNGKAVRFIDLMEHI